jgi:hypothetical protein
MANETVILNNNEATSINSQRTIRDYLSTTLKNSENQTGGVGLKINIENTSTLVYDVDLIWNGQEYLIAYKNGEEELITAEGNDKGKYILRIDEFPTIKRLAEVLPITFATTRIKSEIAIVEHKS